MALELYLDSTGVYIRGTAASANTGAVDLAADWPTDWWRDAIVTTPAFANRHTHPLQSVIRFGRLSGVFSFSDWLKIIRETQENSTAEDFRRATQRCLSENLLNGNSHVTLHCKGLKGTSEMLAIVEQCERSEVRARVFFGLYPEQLSNLKWLRDMAAAGSSGPTTEFGLGPVNLHEFSGEQIAFVIDLANEIGAYIHSHVGETPESAGAVQRLLSLPGDLSRWELVHCVNERPESITCALERGCAIVLCPRSNQFLGLGLPSPLFITEKHRGSIGVGSDGASSGISQSVICAAFSGWMGWSSSPYRPSLESLFALCCRDHDSRNPDVTDLMRWHPTGPLGHPASLLLEFMAGFRERFVLYEAKIDGKYYQADSLLADLGTVNQR